jgi:nicotinate-nucleotide adenylyltransferase
MATVGLLFGSFNPIHTGHLLIAEYFATRGGCDRVELIVSPQNPLKRVSDLAEAHHRLEMAKIAVRGNKRIKVNEIEFSLPVPSYTIDTLRALTAKHPRNQYRLILGSDNFDRFREWKDWQELLNRYPVLAYRRPGHSGSDLEQHPSVKIFEDVPLIHISATYLRECLRKNFSIRYLTPDKVIQYITVHGLFRESGEQI